MSRSNNYHHYPINPTMDASAGFMIMAVLAGLLCLRRRRCPMPASPPSPEERRAEDAALLALETWREGL